MASYYRQQLERWLKQINIKTDRVADIGGAANPVPSRLGSYQANEYVCFDNGVEKAKTQYIQFDINEPIKQLDSYDEQVLVFDVVFCLEVFEYVWNPLRAIKNIHKLLTVGGIAYVSFPAIYPVHNPVEIDYLRYTKRAVELYLTKAGFREWFITPRVASEGRNTLAKFYAEEKMHPLKHSELPFDIGYLVKAIK